MVNNRTINSKFNVLTGEFISQKEDMIHPKFKDYRVEDLDERNDPHLLSKKKTKKEPKSMETKDIDSILADVAKLESTISIESMPGLAALSEEDFLKSQENIAKILSMTNELISSGTFEFTQKKQETSQNTLWDSLYGSIKKQDKKDETYKNLDQDQKKL